MGDDAAPSKRVCATLHLAVLDHGSVRRQTKNLGSDLLNLRIERAQLCVLCRIGDAEVVCDSNDVRHARGRLCVSNAALDSEDTTRLSLLGALRDDR